MGSACLNASPLAMGLLTNQGPQPWFPGHRKLKKRVGKPLSCAGLERGYLLPGNAVLLLTGAHPLHLDRNGAEGGTRNQPARPCASRLITIYTKR